MYIQREETEKILESYLLNKQRTASLCFLRGRRRIGKSTLLKRIANTLNVPSFYFMGADDEPQAQSVDRWITEWIKIYPKTKLPMYSKTKLSWKIIFEEIIQYGIENKKTTLGIFIDEIQWVAKSKSGFIGQFKEAWLELEKLPNLKFIFCGSSNKFFYDYSGGEETILRGLCTHDDIWVSDFNLKVLRENYGREWTLEETVFSLMSLGGVPYYWNQVVEEQSFINSFNILCFTQKTIFLKEAAEMLRLEFNEAGTETVLNIINAIGIHGKELNSIIEKTNIPASTVIDTIKKLLNYKLIHEKKFYELSMKKNKRGTVFLISDPYLNFYVEVLVPLQRKIKNNLGNKLLFADILKSKSGYYIENYSGYAFERLIIKILEKHTDRKEKIFSLIGIQDCDYHVSNLSSKEIQIDIVIHNTSDRVIRLIECRWTQSSNSIIELAKNYEYRAQIFINKFNIKEPIKKYIITNCALTSDTKQSINKSKVKILNLETLI